MVTHAASGRATFLHRPLATRSGGIGRKTQSDIDPVSGRLRRDELASSHSITSSARVSRVVGTLRPMPLLGGRLILEDQAEQEMHVAAVGSAFRRLGSIGSPHLAQVPYVPSDIRFRAASIRWISVVSVFSITSIAS